MSSYGSDSDNDAPEEVSLQTAKQTVRKREREQLDSELQSRKLRKERNRARDKALKRSSKKQKLSDEVVDDVSPDTAEQEDKSSQYLDDALFQSSAALYDVKATSALPGEGKKTIRQLEKEEKRLKKAQLEEKARLAPGSSKQIGDKVLQHLPDTTINPLAGMPIVHPASSSSNKFLANRLYSSKKRAIGVLDKGKGPAPSAKKRKGKMSDESKRLLGLLDPKDEAEEAKKEKKRKKALLLQAEGLRKAPSIARPRRLDRGRKPATDFAVSSYAGKPVRTSL